nr:hypothetical protein [uncultured Acidovorax sp.]
MQLRDYLTKNGLTQHAFGLLMEPPVSQGKVNHWLQGTRRVSLAEALHIQRVTGGEVTVEDLAKGQEKRGPAARNGHACTATETVAGVVHA